MLYKSAVKDYLIHKKIAYCFHILQKEIPSFSTLKTYLYKDLYSYLVDYIDKGYHNDYQQHPIQIHKHNHFYMLRQMANLNNDRYYLVYFSFNLLYHQLFMFNKMGIIQAIIVYLVPHKY